MNNTCFYLVYIPTNQQNSEVDLAETAAKFMAWMNNYLLKMYEDVIVCLLPI